MGSNGPQPKPGSVEDLISWAVAGAIFLAVATTALTVRGAPPAEPASAGAVLTKRAMLGETLRARTSVILHEEPWRPYWLPLGHVRPEEKETLPAGTTVRVTRVGETHIGWRRNVWWHVATIGDPERSGWYPLGSQYGATAAVREEWEREPQPEADGRSPDSRGEKPGAGQEQP